MYFSTVAIEPCTLKAKTLTAVVVEIELAVIFLVNAVKLSIFPTTENLSSMFIAEVQRVRAVLYWSSISKPGCQGTRRHIPGMASTIQ